MKNLFERLASEVRIGAKHTFSLVFGKSDPILHRLQTLKAETWQQIASPKTLGDGTIVIFSYEHRLVKDAIYIIKNKKDEAVAKAMAAVASDYLLEELSELELLQSFTDPLILSIPTSNRRKLKRGFNPSELVARSLQDAIPSLMFKAGVLVKVRETKPQKELSRHERLENVKQSMTVRDRYKETVRGRCIIVVDDVTTTGATLAEAKRALADSGARRVLTFALAH